MGDSFDPGQLTDCAERGTKAAEALVDAIEDFVNAICDCREDGSDDGYYTGLALGRTKSKLTKLLKGGMP